MENITLYLVFNCLFSVSEAIAVPCEHGSQFLEQISQI